MRSILRRLWWTLSRTRKLAELDEELRFHIEEEREEREAAGETAEQARRNALLDFGNLSVVREDTRSAWGWTSIEQLAQDLRYAVRTIRRTPSFTLLAVVSLALGIGANVAIFSFMDAMLFRGLPVRDPGSLVRMTWHTPKSEMHGMSRHDSYFRSTEAGFTAGVFSYAAFEEFRTHDDLFSAVFAYQGAGALTISVNGQADTMSGEFVSGEYFEALGAAPAAGRWLDERDDRMGAPPVAVLSSAASRARFPRAADAIGRVILVNTTPYTIVGVMTPEFYGTDPGQAPGIYLPLHSNVLVDASPRAALERYGNAGTWWLEIMARRRPGVSIGRVQAELAPRFQQMSDELKANSRRWQQAPSLEVKPGGGGIDSLRRTYGTPLFMLIALAVLILALACANIANLLLARSGARAREMAIRLSVGAGRGRVIRQLLTESVVLAAVAGAAGTGVAFWLRDRIAALVDNGQPFGARLDLNWPALAVAIGLSMLTGILFGLAPALQATRSHAMAALKQSRIPASTAIRGTRSNRILLAGQFAIALVMLIAAGLFLQTLRNYQAIALGYSSDHVLTFALRAGQAGLGNDEAIAFFRALRDRLRAVPGVQGVGLSGEPVIGSGASYTSVQVPGREGRESSLVMTVGGGFFSTMKMPIVRGRPIGDSDDRPGAPPVVVIDETYAETYFGRENPIGQHVWLPGDSPKVRDVRFEIIGVAANARIGRLAAPREPTAFFPFSAAPFGDVGEMMFELRVDGNALAYANTARQIVHAIDPRVPVARLMTQDALIQSTISREVLMARVCLAFAILALTIAVVGLYGIVSHEVSRRRLEIGIRMALGARQPQVVGMILREILLVVAAGLCIGVPAAGAATKITEALLFGVTRADWPTTVAAVGVLATTALLAGLMPAWSATRGNPAATLRNE